MKAVIISIVLVYSLFSTSSNGHEVRPSYLELIQQTEKTFDVLWKVPAKGGEYRFGLTVQFDHTVINTSEPVERFSGGSYTKRWKISHEKGLIETEIFIRGLKSTFTEALVRIERLDGSVQVSRLMPQNPRIKVNATPTVSQVALTYTELGIKHIWSGIDHLLFLVCLLFIAGTSRRVLITITGFTVAHSITLALSALNIIKLSVGPVEAIIALSIVFLATEIVKGKRNTLTWNYPVTVAASFGLLHGFGFAAVLNEIGLPQTEIIAGLLFFNIGVEIGQVVFIMAIILLFKNFTPLQLVMRKGFIQKPLIYSLGSFASFWLIERSVDFLI